MPINIKREQSLPGPGLELGFPALLASELAIKLPKRGKIPVSFSPLCVCVCERGFFFFVWAIIDIHLSLWIRTLMELPLELTQTNSIAYGIRRYNAAFTSALQ